MTSEPNRERDNQSMTTLPDHAGPPDPVNRLIALARDHYRPVLGQDGRSYALPLSGPALACPMETRGRDGLRSRLAGLYYDTCRRPAKGAALTAAVAALACEADTTEPVPVTYRVARPSPRRAVVDLGDRAGRCVIVEPGGWLVVERPPVVFRRTALTGELPTPTYGAGGLEQLRQLANVRSAVVWRLVLGWLVAALLDEPAPVLALTGPTSAGKSCAGRMLVELVDPQPAPLRRPPRDLRDWATTASACYVVGLDGITGPTPWLADILGRTIEGAGIVHCPPNDRHGEVDVLTLRRAVLVTAQARGPLGAALGPRAAVVPLAPIPERQRRPEADLWAAYDTARPHLLGALLTTTAQVLAALPDVEPCELDGPCGRFGCVLAALDACGATGR